MAPAVPWARVDISPAAVTGSFPALYGTTADWVTGVDILTVDSQGKVALRNCTAKQDADLLRACRGAGGGNFGVIVDYIFDNLPPAPQEVMVSNMIFPWAEMTEEKFHQIFDAFGGYFATRGKDPETWGLFSIIEANHKARGYLRIEVQFCNPDGTCKDTKVMDEFLALFRRLQAFGRIAGRAGQQSSRGELRAA